MILRSFLHPSGIEENPKNARLHGGILSLNLAPVHGATLLVWPILWSCKHFLYCISGTAFTAIITNDLTLAKSAQSLYLIAMRCTRVKEIVQSTLASFFCRAQSRIAIRRSGALAPRSNGSRVLSSEFGQEGTSERSQVHIAWIEAL